jgi:hypothetical protein
LIYFQAFYVFAEFFFNILHCMPNFIQLFICIPSKFIKVIMCVSSLILGTIHIIISFEFLDCDFIHFIFINMHYYGIVYFGEVILLCFLYFLCFCIGICTSEAESLAGGFNLLYSFKWSILNIQAGLCSGGIEV